MFSLGRSRFGSKSELAGELSDTDKSSNIDFTIDDHGLTLSLDFTIPMKLDSMNSSENYLASSRLFSCVRLLFDCCESIAADSPLFKPFVPLPAPCGRFNRFDSGTDRSENILVGRGSAEAELDNGLWCSGPPSGVVAVRFGAGSALLLLGMAVGGNSEPECCSGWTVGEGS